jgi:hypothetical protein
MVNGINKMKYNTTTNTNKILQAEAKHTGINTSTYVLLYGFFFFQNKEPD